MAQVPDDLHASCFRGPEHRQETGPVVPPRRPLNEVPAQAVPDGQDVVLAQGGVILRDEAVVLRRGEEIETTPVAAAMARGLEAAEKEAAEAALGCCRHRRP